MQHMTHAEAVVAFERLQVQFKALKLEVENDYVTPVGRLFFVIDPASKNYLHRVFSCSSIEELTAWGNAYMYAKGL